MNQRRTHHHNCSLFPAAAHESEVQLTLITREPLISGTKPFTSASLSQCDSIIASSSSSFPVTKDQVALFVTWRHTVCDTSRRMEGRGRKIPGSRASFSTAAQLFPASRDTHTHTCRQTCSHVYVCRSGNHRLWEQRDDREGNSLLPVTGMCLCVCG